MHLRFAPLLSTLALTVFPAAAQNLYSGNAFDRAIGTTQLPPGSGTIDRIELGAFVGDVEPDLLLLRGDQLLLARDVASLATYEVLASGVVDFVVLRGGTSDRIAVATTGGVDLYVPGSGDVLAVTSLSTAPATRLREVRLDTDAGIAAWGNGDVRVYDEAGALVLSQTPESQVVDVVTGDFLVDATWDLAVLTKSTLYVYDGSGGEASLTLSAASSDGRLGFAPGSAAGLDLLLWLDGSWIHNFNELWQPYSFVTAGTDVRAMHAIDYHADANGLADLVVIDAEGRQAMVLARQDPQAALATGWEFVLPGDPNTTLFIPLDGETAGAPLHSATGDFDLDGDADLIALSGATEPSLRVRPGERIDAEAQRIKIHDPVLYEPVLGSSDFLIGFLDLDPSSPGPAFPAAATHLELTIWESPTSGEGPDPLVTRYPIGAGAGQIPNQSTAGEINFPFAPGTFAQDTVYYLRLRAVREEAAGDQLFPSRIDVFTFGTPDVWTPPAGWQTYPYAGILMTDPEGTGGLRGGGGGPIPPGS